MTKTILKWIALFALQLALPAAAQVQVTPAAAGYKQLSGHVPEIVHRLASIGRLSSTHELQLAIGVPLRDQAGLDKFLAAVCDPANPNYRHYLTPEEFASRFSATAADYAAVCEFARTNGFQITRTHANRMLLEVTARAADVERAFHLKLNLYQHPTEARTFFAPDMEPTLVTGMAVADIQGLSDYGRPHPHVMKSDTGQLEPQSGSSPNGLGSYFGDDFRNAYAYNTTLTGAGQSVGLLQFDGFYASDIAAYAAAAGGGRTNIAIQTILASANYNGTPTSKGNTEVSLDIEMAMAMAPGLARIVVFEANPTNGLPNSILAAMVTNIVIKQFSSSWGWSAGPRTTTDNYFKQMIVQGQSFFNATGDSEAFTVGWSSTNGVDNVSLSHAPASSPYVTQVGGTTLSTDGGAAYSAETVWNWNNGKGSSGGVSSYYPLPGWQSGVSMTLNGGSALNRNIPDVALTANNVYVGYGNGASKGVGGTSCAAPLWAGFMALVNQQWARVTGSSTNSVGFINPAIYSIGTGQNSNYTYTACFHDITDGNNYSANSPTNYSAVTGYDLCTGWGTPKGQTLINALTSVLPPAITSQPASQTNLVGRNVVFSVTATGTAPLTYQWSTQGVNLVNGSGVSGATSNVLTLTGITTNSAGSYAVVVTNPYGSDTSSVAVLSVYLPITAPLVCYLRLPNVSLMIAISDLLTNVMNTYASSIFLVGVGTDGLNLRSTNGATLFTNSTFIFYTNSVTPNVNDSFNYTVADAGQQSSGMVYVIVTNTLNFTVGQTSPRLITTSNHITANFFGVPGCQYTVDRSTNMVNWVPISTNTAPGNGLIQVQDGFQDLGIRMPPGPSAAYYRLRYGP